MVYNLTLPQELVGEKIVVKKAKNPFNVGIKGEIVDETKSTIKVKTDLGKIKTLLKQEITFELSSMGKVIEGESLIKRPEERLKG